MLWPSECVRRSSPALRQFSIAMSTRCRINFVAYQPGVDESKIDGLSFRLAFYAFQSTRSYDTCPQLRRVCHMYEERDVNRRGEMWISEAFHLTNLPTISLTLVSKISSVSVVYAYDWTRQTLCNSSPSRYSSPLSHLRSPLRAPNTNSYHPKPLPRLLQRVTGECLL